MITLFATNRLNRSIWPSRFTRVDEGFAYYRCDETGVERAIPLRTVDKCIWRSSEEALAHIIREQDELVKRLGRGLDQAESDLAELRQATGHIDDFAIVVKNNPLVPEYTAIYPLKKERDYMLAGLWSASAFQDHYERNIVGSR